MPSIAASRIQYLQSRISRFDDQLAYKELFTNFYPALFQFVTGIVKSRQSAEEIVSDLFIKIWEKRQSHADIDEFKSHLFYSAPDPEECMIRAEMLRLIHDVVEDLPPRCKLSF